MALIEDELYTHLVGRPAISAVIGTRMHPHFIPQDEALPAIVFEPLSAGSVSSLSGPSGLAGPTLRLTAVAESYVTAKDLAEAIRLELVGVRGATWGTLRIYGVVPVESQEQPEVDPNIFAVSRDYTIWFAEAKP